MADLYESADESDWQRALADYPAVIGAQGVRRLPELDAWYREELPALITARRPGSVTAVELARLTEWKMARGVWRQRNLVLVRSNSDAEVAAVSAAALARIPDPSAPITMLAKLHGVGPATASAVASAAAPAIYPFFDDLVAGAIPGFGAVDFTTRCYVRYADALRERASRLGGDWTPTRVERALWAAAGGKAGAARSETAPPRREEAPQ